MRGGGVIQLDPADLRLAAAGVVAGGAALQLLPFHSPFVCPLKTLTGMPCPLCGMTTSVEATIRLDLADAVSATPAGIFAVAAAIALLVLRPSVIRVRAGGVFAALAAMWVFQLYRFSIL